MHLKLCLAGAIHNFKWVKIIHICTTWTKKICHSSNLSPYSTGTDFSRQNLTSVDIRFWRLKSIAALKSKLKDSPFL